ncbi:seryl-tRNA synthetase [Entomortierella parvispora]|uniref:serine--tRNA ligase n=1 Tax=Entomortierella parvispora TaxID=205924 RepID=A0A9P3LTY1_9FUNG|nr:seryl-tRNA synthetase [Entomortierella parvispora]
MLSIVRTKCVTPRSVHAIVSSRSALANSQGTSLSKQTRQRLSTTSRLFKSLESPPSTPVVVAEAGIDQTPALILKPHINFKALAGSASAMESNIKHRNLPDSISVATVNALYRTVGEKTHQLEMARAERNQIAAEMKSLFGGEGSKSKKSKTATNSAETMSREDKEARRQELVLRGKAVKEGIHVQEAELSALESELYERAVMIPNSTHPTSPIGPESAAQLVRLQGTPRLSPGVKAYAHPSSTGENDDEHGQALQGEASDYPLLDHVSLSKSLDLMDFESATAVTGSRWYYLKNEAALLELALIQFATQRAVQAGYMPVITPDVVRPEVVQACGFQPRDEASQTYWVSTVAPGSARASTVEGVRHHQRSALCLVATAEIALAGMNLNKVLKESQLPIKMAGFGRAFRAEAGSRGAEVKGLYRVHQFSKVELFVLSKDDQGESDRILEEIRQFQENIFEELGLCYRVLDMPTEELGASAYKKYDIEAWMPGRNGWGEISSTSNCTDYQARRLNIRYRGSKSASQRSVEDSEGGLSTTTVPSLKFVHTLNGTAMAIPRIIVALLETYQQKDGSVRLPECLWPFMGGVQTIEPKKSEN